MSPFLYSLFAATFAFVCVFLILLVLIQKGRGGGLSSAFGGAGGNTAFGSKTGDVLTWVTSVVFVVFMLLAMLLIWTADAVVARENLIRQTPADVSGDVPAGPQGQSLLGQDGPRPSPPPAGPAADDTFIP